MRLLLDTHILIWLVAEPERIHFEARQILKDPATQVLFSAVSIWEIAIKSRLGRSDFPPLPLPILHQARAPDFVELPIIATTAAVVATLPLHHRDPFDRLLIAQAIVENIPLCTADRQLTRYSDLVTLVG